MRIEIRAATLEDRPVLEQVYASTRVEEMALVAWSAEEKEDFLRMQFEAQDRWYRQTYPDATFGLLVVDGATVGRITVDRWPEEIRIVDVALLPEHRGRGIGSRVLEGILGEGEAAGIPVTIHVEKTNPARSLYARLGFEVVDDRGVYLFLARPPVPLSEDRLVAHPIRVGADGDEEQVDVSEPIVFDPVDPLREQDVRRCEEQEREGVPPAGARGSGPRGLRDLRETRLDGRPVVEPDPKGLSLVGEKGLEGQSLKHVGQSSKDPVVLREAATGH